MKKWYPHTLEQFPDPLGKITQICTSTGKGASLPSIFLGDVPLIAALMKQSHHVQHDDM
jgi:hypothetical protein